MYWVDKIVDGDDAGYFGPGSAAWAVHGGLPTLVAGIRALLMQTLHPGAMAGVHDWSRYREDPLGRLSGTIQWLVTVTFADTALARVESARVGRFHERVVGNYLDARGEERPYAAGDPELLSWVHVVFTDAFLRSHEIWEGDIPGGADGYVREWGTAGELIGVVDPPRSDAALRASLDAFRDAGILKSDDRVAEGGDHDPEVTPSEVDADRVGVVVEQPDRQCSPPGARGRDRLDRAGRCHQPHEVGDGRGGQPGLSGELGLGGRAAREERVDDPLLIRQPEGGLRTGVWRGAGEEVTRLEHV